MGNRTARLVFSKVLYYYLDIYFFSYDTNMNMNTFKKKITSLPSISFCLLQMSDF